jgi:hypothetical protein
MGDVVGFIYNSNSSAWLRTAGWVIPAVRTIHILALSVLLGGSVLIDMKLAGILARADSGAALIRRYMPSVWIALAVMLVSGTLLFWAEPERALTKQIFWIKMGLVLVAFLLTFVIRKRMLLRDERRAPASFLDIAFAFVALAIWLAALFCGRWIAYSY